MALTDLRTSIGTCNSADTFNALMADYSLSSVIEATFDEGETYAHFNVFNVSFTSGIYQNYSSGIWDAIVTCYIDTDNEILVLVGNNLCYMALFYGSQSNFLVVPYSVISDPFAVYNQSVEPLYIAEVGEPSIVNDTFSGHLFYSEDKIFTEVVRYITTPTTLFGTNIKTPTKDIMIMTNATAYNSTGGCIAIALDL